MSQSTTEIRIVPLAPGQDLLTDLCASLPEPAPKGGKKGGRPTVPMRDAAFLPRQPIKQALIEGIQSVKGAQLAADPGATAGSR